MSDTHPDMLAIQRSLGKVYCAAESRARDTLDTSGILEQLFGTGAKNTMAREKSYFFDILKCYVIFL